VLGFSDLQADIAAELIRNGVNVHIYNQRSVEEIYSMLLTLGAMVGCQSESEQWIANMENKISTIKAQTAAREHKPRVFFEEWFDPVISGIQWVSEIVRIAGGDECFPELAGQSLARNRIIADHREVAARDPEIFLGSWCGRKFRPEHVYEREGWEQVSCVKNRQVFEIKSANILQPGPAALTDGLDQIKSIIDNWYESGFES
jgi:iron complex transport system substrate-binding protein